MLYNIIVLLVMFLVTYIPRAIPVSFIKKPVRNRFIKSFLHYTPYAVIASQTFPSIIYFTDNIYLGIIGTVISVATALFTDKLWIVASVSVLSVFGLSFIFI